MFLKIVRGRNANTAGSNPASSQVVSYTLYQYHVSVLVKYFLWHCNFIQRKSVSNVSLPDYLGNFRVLIKYCVFSLKCCLFYSELCRICWRSICHLAVKRTNTDTERNAKYKFVHTDGTRVENNMFLYPGKTQYFMNTLYIVWDIWPDNDYGTL